jgi:hypothetical protein
MSFLRRTQECCRKSERTSSGLVRWPSLPYHPPYACSQYDLEAQAVYFPLTGDVLIPSALEVLQSLTDANLILSIQLLAYGTQRQNMKDTFAAPMIPQALVSPSRIFRVSCSWLFFGMYVFRRCLNNFGISSG